MKLALPAGVAAFAALLAVLPVTSSPAGASEVTVVNRDRITFPNAGPTAATPFPSIIGAVGASSAVTDVNVRLGDLSHAFPADLDIEVVGPDGTAVALMSDQCDQVDMVHTTLFFDDEAAAPLPASTDEGCTSGSFRPGNVASVTTDEWAVEPTGESLAAFDGSNPDGSWRLFVRDDGVADTGDIGAGWALQITTADGGVLAIPGAGTNGSGPASVYPLELPVAGRTGTITDVDLTLPGVSHTFPGDLDVLLVSPRGTAVLVMNEACGGRDIEGLTFTFDDEAGQPLGGEGSCHTGRFRPSALGSPLEVLPAPAPTAPYAHTLAAFDGSDANGTWQLFVFDRKREDAGFVSEQPRLDIATTDIVAPGTRIIRKPRSSAARTARVTFTSSEAGSRFECRVDRQRFKPCSSPLRLKHLSVGPHRVTVRAVDGAGNADASPAEARWKVRRG